MSERRNIQRSKAVKAGIVQSGFGRGIECTIRDVSYGGACLVFAHRRTALPKAFVLTSPADSTGKRCELVWQSAYRVGVRFADEH